MKFNKLMAVLLVFGLILSGPVTVLAEEELIIETQTNQEAETVIIQNNVSEESASILTSGSYDSPDIFINSISEDTGISDMDNITYDNTPTFFGGSNIFSEDIILSYYPISCDHLEDNSVCPIDVSSSVRSLTDAEGNWAVSFDEIQDGEYFAIATGPASNSSNKFYFTIDTQKPIIENSYFYNGATYNINFYDENIKSFTNNISISINFKNQSFLKAKIYVWDMHQVNTSMAEKRESAYLKEFDYTNPENFDLENLNLPDSSYRVIVEAEDVAGNIIHVGEKTFTFSIDRTLPQAPVITSPVSGPYVKQSPLVITGTCDFNPNLKDIIIGFTNFGDIVAVVVECLEDGTFSTSVDYSETINPITYPISFSAYYNVFSEISSNKVVLTEPQVSSIGGSSVGNTLISVVQNSGGGVVDLEFLKNPISNIGAVNNNSYIRSVALGNTDDTTKSSNSCPHFTKYIKMGADNDSGEVKKWQKFLNETQGENLDVDGIYGPLTFSAINRFQQKHTEDVLKPWNTVTPTGFIYLTTTKMANKLLGC